MYLNMNYWAAPGLKKYFVFKPLSKQEIRSFRTSVSISPNSGIIRFHTGAVKLMNLTQEDKIGIVLIDELLFFYKSTDGSSLYLHHANDEKKQHAATLLARLRPLGFFFRKAMTERKVTLRSFRCEIRPTGSQFYGNDLFEALMPTIIKSAAKRLQLKNKYQSDLRDF